MSKLTNMRVIIKTSRVICTCSCLMVIVLTGAFVWQEEGSIAGLLASSLLLSMSSFFSWMYFSSLNER